MKKIAPLLSLVSYLSLTPFAYAQTKVDTCVEGQFDILCKLDAGDFGGVVGSIIQLIFVVAVVAALLYLIYGGFRWLISTGDKSKVAEAREHIIAAIIGLVIIFLAYFIINLLMGFFGLGSLSNLTIPKVQLGN